MSGFDFYGTAFFKEAKPKLTILFQFSLTRNEKCFNLFAWIGKGTVESFLDG